MIFSVILSESDFLYRNNITEHFFMLCENTNSPKSLSSVISNPFFILTISMTFRSLIPGVSSLIA